jgi:hypothetical protein
MALPMKRPKGRTGAPKKLYLDPKVTRRADDLAFSFNLSLSQLVENLLRRELEEHAFAKKESATR